MAKSIHIFKRGDTWYFRRRVPAHLVARAECRILQYSLETRDKAQAQRRATIADANADIWFSQLELSSNSHLSGKNSVSASKKVTIEELIEHARTFVEIEDRRREARFLENPPVDADERDEMRIDVGLRRTDLQTEGHPDRSIETSKLATLLAQKVGLPDDEDQFPAALGEISVRALVELLRRQEARLIEDYTRTHFDTAFAPRPPDQRPKLRFGELIDQYFTEVQEDHKLNGIALKTTKKTYVTLEYLREAVGDDTPVASIDDDLLQKLRSIIARTPANKSKIYPEFSLSEAIQLAEKDGKPTLKHLTQRTYLDCFRNLLKLAVRKKLLASNPAEGIQPLLRETVSLSEKREPFSPEQIQKFFMGSFYRSCAPDAPNPYEKSDRIWRFWIPLIMLFSGARPNEICQLFIEDIQQTAVGTWYFDLKEENEEKKLKNQASRRRVPIHPELIKLGLLQLIANRRALMKQNGPRLFFELKSKSKDPKNFAWYVGKRFNETFLPAEMQVGERQVLYSLRHSVRDALRRSKAGEEALLAIGGWTPSGGSPVSSNYGDIKNPDLWVSEVAAIAYKGLDLKFLYPKAA